MEAYVNYVANSSTGIYVCQIVFVLDTMLIVFI